MCAATAPKLASPNSTAIVPKGRSMRDFEQRMYMVEALLAAQMWV
jgi:hypothetical protein